MYTRLQRLVFERGIKYLTASFRIYTCWNLLQTLLGLDKILLKLIAPATVWAFYYV